MLTSRIEAMDTETSESIIFCSFHTGRVYVLNEEFIQSIDEKYSFKNDIVNKKIDNCLTFIKRHLDKERKESQQDLSKPDRALYKLGSAVITCGPVRIPRDTIITSEFLHQLKQCVITFSYPLTTPLSTRKEEPNNPCYSEFNL
jgi:hypothetical protein